MLDFVIKLGRSYLNTEGKEVEIVFVDKNCYVDLNGNTYHHDGKVISRQVGASDLVEEISPPNLILEVGKDYFDKSGQVVRVVEKRPIPRSPSFFFVGNNYLFYTVNGLGIPTTTNDRMNGKPDPLVDEYKELLLENAMPKLNLEVGKVYETANGDKVFIASKTPHWEDGFHFTSRNGLDYTPDGKGIATGVFPAGSFAPVSLVKESPLNEYLQTIPSKSPKFLNWLKSLLPKDKDRGLFQFRSTRRER